MAKKDKRGNPGNGIGHMPSVMPLARGMVSKNKRDMKDREDRKNRHRGWE
jgi:hypothetical protein